jgi:ABC-type branched-subunit amino acid transport system substrate-binding protein
LSRRLAGRRAAVAVASAAVLGVLAGCTKPAVPTALPSDGPLVLGTLLPVTGGFAHLGPAEQAGLQLAVKDIDAGGGVLGQPVTVLDSDSGDAFSAVASQSVDRMLARKVDAIVGGTGSSVTLTVIDKVVGAGVALVSPGDASAKLDGYPDRGLYERIVPPESFEASTLAAMLKAAGHRRVAVLFERDAYATGYAADLQADVRRNGGATVAAIEYDGRSTDFSSAARQVAGAAPQAVVVIGTGEAHALVQALVGAGVGPDVAPLYVSDLALWPGLTAGLTATQSAAVTGLRPGAAPGAQFLQRLAQQAPDLADTGYAAQTYDATVLVALAASAAGSPRGKDIAAALPALTTGSTECSAYKQCRELLKAGRTIAYVGQSGKVRLDAQGEPVDGTVGIYRFGADGTYPPVGSYVSGTFPPRTG